MSDRHAQLRLSDVVIAERETRREKEGKKKCSNFLIKVQSGEHIKTQKSINYISRAVAGQLRRSDFSGPHNWSANDALIPKTNISQLVNCSAAGPTLERVRSVKIIVAVDARFLRCRLLSARGL